MRFYPVNATGKITGEVYTAPEGYAADTIEPGPNGVYGPAQLLLAQRGEETTYLVVNPATAQDTEVAFSGSIEQAQGGVLGYRYDSESGRWTTPDGGVVTTYNVFNDGASATDPSGKGTGYAVRTSDGSLALSTSQKTPDGLDPGSPQLVGIYGKYAALWWRVGTFNGDLEAWRNRPSVAALHDLTTGNVVASVQAEHTGVAPGPLLAAPDGSLLASGNVIFDLKARKHYSTVPPQLHLQYLTSDGIGYGVGQENRSMAVDVKTTKLHWDTPEQGTVPRASSSKALIFTLNDDVKTVIAFPLK